ncbi:MAG: RNA polymerase sigma factor [Phycisphaerales bacterium]
MDVSDLDLLLRMHRGEAVAAETLWRRFGPRLVAHAAAIAHSDAEDVVQGVFLDVMEMKRSECARVRDVAAWLVTLTRRGCLNALRASRRERARRARSVTGAKEVRYLGATSDLLRACEALPRRQREVILLRDILGLSFDQMQIALGVPRSTAASRHQAARSALAALLARDNPPARQMEVMHG